MFTNITEEDLRVNCPHEAPMTLRAFNKIVKRQFNTRVNPLNPFEVPRYAPSTVSQYSKALSNVAPTNTQGLMALMKEDIQQTILADTEETDFINAVVEEAEEEKAEEPTALDAFISSINKEVDLGVEGLAGDTDPGKYILPYSGEIMAAIAQLPDVPSLPYMDDESNFREDRLRQFRDRASPEQTMFPVDLGVEGLGGGSPSGVEEILELEEIQKEEPADPFPFSPYDI